MRTFLSDSVKTSIAITPAAGAAGTTDITGATLDTAGFDATQVVVVFGAITSSAATSLKIQTGDASDMSDAADLEGTSITIADTDDSTIAIIDVTHSPERYLRVYCDRATANAVVAAAVYQQYRARFEPITQHADVAHIEQHAAAVSGTA